MTTHLTTPSTPSVRSPASGLIPFVAVALPVGWLLLSVPLVVDLPLEPFILATLLFGLVVPAFVLTRRQPGASVTGLLRDTVRIPRPVWLLVPAALLVPFVTGAVGAPFGADRAPTTSLLIDVLSSLVIVNLWEEMVWAGYVQRRATGRWGLFGGAALTALLFTGVHLPMSLYGANGVGDVAFNIGAMLVAGLGLRLLIGAFDGWTGGSILALGLLHATFNASGDLLVPGADWIRYVVTLGLGLAAYAVAVRTRR